MNALEFPFQPPYFKDIKLTIYMPERQVFIPIEIPSGPQTDEIMHCSLDTSYLRMLNEVDEPTVNC